MDRHLVTQATDAHHADEYALDKLIQHETATGHHQELTDLASLGTGSTERLRMIDALHKIVRGELSESTLTSTNLGVIYFKNMRADALASQPSTASIPLSSYSLSERIEGQRLSDETRLLGQAQAHGDGDLYPDIELMHQVTGQQDELAHADITASERVAISGIASRHAFDLVLEQYSSSHNPELRQIERFRQMLDQHHGTNPIASSLEEANLLLSGLVNMQGENIPHDFVKRLLDERGEQIRNLIEQRELERVEPTQAMDRIAGSFGPHTDIARVAVSREALAAVAASHPELARDNISILESRGNHVSPTIEMTRYVTGETSADSLGVSSEFIRIFDAERKVVSEQMTNEITYASANALQHALQDSQHKTEVEHVLLQVAGTQTGGTREEVILESIERILNGHATSHATAPIEAAYNQLNHIDPSFLEHFKTERNEQLKELPLTASMTLYTERNFSGLNQFLSGEQKLTESQFEALGEWVYRINVESHMLSESGIPLQARSWALKEATGQAIRESHTDIEAAKRYIADHHPETASDRVAVGVLDRLEDHSFSDKLLPAITSGVIGDQLPKSLVDNIINRQQAAVHQISQELNDARLRAFTEAENQSHFARNESWRHHIEYEFKNADHAHGGNTDEVIRDVLTKIELGTLSWSDVGVSVRFRNSYEHLKRQQAEYQKMPSILVT